MIQFAGLRFTTVRAERMFPGSPLCFYGQSPHAVQVGATPKASLVEANVHRTFSTIQRRRTCEHALLACAHYFMKTASRSTMPAQRRQEYTR